MLPKALQQADPVSGTVRRYAPPTPISPDLLQTSAVVQGRAD